ncbi:unnamed protein product [Closterium sp. NIES-64]|nr:unnamed protein product [Closterium sp. NIES-64]
MSAGYAAKLSYREDVGTVGSPEYEESGEALRRKLHQLVDIFISSKRVVAFTGAGISTAAGVPDFRGPSGIWTLQRQGQSLPSSMKAFGDAVPSLTHMALLHLLRLGRVHCIISQNVDGLHARSGVPRSHLVELHGSCFRELCHRCGAEYQRAFELESIGQKASRRRCTAAACVALGTAPRLRDSVLDWEDALPPSELQRAEDECSQADLVLCLATSLQITPAANLPLRALRNGGRIVIVNLQKTPKDKKASLVIAARVDQVMAHLMSILHLTIPPFHRTYSLHIRHCLTPIQPQGKGKGKKHHAAAQPSVFTNRWKLSVAVESTLGALAPLPSLDCIHVSFPDSWPLDELTLTSPPYTFNRTFKLQMQQAEGAEGEGEKQQQQGVTPSGAISFTFNFSQGYGCEPITIHHAVAPCPCQVCTHLNLHLLSTASLSSLHLFSTFLPPSLHLLSTFSLPSLHYSPRHFHLFRAFTLSSPFPCPTSPSPSPSVSFLGRTLSPPHQALRRLDS